MSEAEDAKYSPLTDQEIVERVRAGQGFLFEVLMRRHNEKVYRAVRAILKNEAEVEDVMQAAYLSAYAHLDQFAGMARFSTWLVKIAVTQALSRARELGRSIDMDVAPEPDEVIKLPASPPRDPEQAAAVHELSRALEAAVDRLPDIYRPVFMLREVEGLSTSETAECLGVSEEVIKVRLHRAKALLRADLEGQLGSAALALFRFYDARCDRVAAAVLQRIAPIRRTP